jgi:hypothetical protein
MQVSEEYMSEALFLPSATTTGCADAGLFK